MILLAVKFTEGKLSHGEEHEIGISLRDRLLSFFCSVADVEFGVKDGGKPYIIGSDITYSISHTSGCVACALCASESTLPFVVDDVSGEIDSDGIYKISDAVFGGDIGFDVELVDRAKPEKRLVGIADRFFNNEEKSSLEKAEDKYTAFYKTWTGKESIIKCSGIGMAGIEKADTFNSEGRLMFAVSLANNGVKFESSICVDTL